MTILSKLQLWNYMLQDMKEPVSYLPQAILIGLAAAAAGSFLLFTENRIKKGPLPGRSRSAGRHAFLIFTLFLFAVYLTVLLQEAFFSRPPGSRTSVNLELLGTWGHSAQGNAYVIENIIMFIPWGMLLPLLIAPMQKRGWLCVLTAFLASVSLETVQYLTQRGHCQLDDVIMNTLGAFAGWLVIRVMLGVISHLEYHTSRR